MKLIDVDAYFSAFLHAWLEEHQDNLLDIDKVEVLMPSLYDAFLHAPAEWLGGALPYEYFDGLDGARLVALMMQYLDEAVPVPDLLLERITASGSDAEELLYDILTGGSAGDEARMLAIRLLDEMGSTRPLTLYISWQLQREDSGELADSALGSLDEMGEAAVLPMIEALPEANEAGQEAMLSILSRYPEYIEVYDALIRLFDTCPARQAVLAACLGRLGDSRALPLLLQRAEEENLKYLDYIELRAAIETLGGEAPWRVFDEDPEYEALRGKM
jgi:hypothetical protein